MSEQYDFSIGKAILVGIGAGILLPIAFYIAFQIGNAKEREYVKNGVLTPCYVETIVAVRGKQQVWVVYQNEQGKNVRAKAILNKFVGVGETVDAYVLSSNPDEVYYPAASIWKWLVYIIAGIFAVAAWIPLAVLLIKNHNDKQNAILYEQMRAMNQKNREQ